MSARIAYVITCDHPGCGAEHGRGLHDDEFIARGAAGGDHWRQRRVKNGRRSKWLDICPDHRQDGDV